MQSICSNARIDYQVVSIGCLIYNGFSEQIYDVLKTISLKHIIQCFKNCERCEKEMNCVLIKLLFPYFIIKHLMKQSSNLFTLIIGNKETLDSA